MISLNRSRVVSFACELCDQVLTSRGRARGRLAGALGPCKSLKMLQLDQTTFKKKLKTLSFSIKDINL